MKIPPEALAFVGLDPQKPQNAATFFEALAGLAPRLALADAVLAASHGKREEEILVAAKIAVSAGDSAQRVADTIDAAEVAIRTAEPMVTSLYLEPDIYHADYTPAARPERPSAPSH